MSDLGPLRKKIHAQMPDVMARLRALAAAHAPGAPPRAPYRIAAAVDDPDTTVIRVMDEIWWGGVRAEDVVRDLVDITTPEIRVEINSPGGDVWDGIAIYNALRQHPAHVTTRVDGIAASIASVILQAGDRRVMVAASQAMIHNAWGFTVGDAGDHSATAAVLAQQDDVIAGIYASRSGRDRDRFRALMDAETWFTDETAVEAGLADEVYDPPAKTADKAPTLHSQLSEAMAVVLDAISSAERVDALRADAGKDLSVRNRDSLVGLRDAIDRLDILLTHPADAPADVYDEYARFVALTQGL